METTEQARARALVKEVLVEAFGASATPFLPVPFVDDWMHARLLRRIAAKVLMRHALGSPPGLPKVVVAAFVAEGAPSIARSIAVGAARFVVRKLAIVLDVKKGYDVFGQAIVFALALDLAATRGWLHEASAERVGGAIHRALAEVGSGAIEALGRTGRDAFARGPSHLGDAIAAEVERTRQTLEPALRRALRVAQHLD